jgi:hypothetical protein
MSVWSSDELLARLKDPLAFADEIVRRDLVAFAQRAFPTIRGGASLELNWHIDAIACALSRVDDGSCKRLLITLPPRQLKSFMTSVAWVAWRLGQDPRLSFVCVSYSNELSAKFARDCRTIMQSEWYRRTFPRTIISQSRTAAHDFDTSVGGGRLATSVGGTLTGRGGDNIVLDDVLKPDEASSETARESVNEWFSSTLASRLNDKKRGAIVAVMQRLHQYDLAGMLLEGDEWKELSLPAIAIEDCQIPLTRGRVHQRREGEPLHPKREPREVLEQIKGSIGSTAFAAQYQQQPVPAKGNVVKADWLISYSELPQRGRIVQSWDTASKTEERHDWSVCITAHVCGRKAYIRAPWPPAPISAANPIRLNQSEIGKAPTIPAPRLPKRQHNGCGVCAASRLPDLCASKVAAPTGHWVIGRKNSPRRASSAVTPPTGAQAPC